MSDYKHDLKKFATSGLQLRLPVDLIPATQYGRLTNAIPVIEGELRTRDGVTLVGIPTEVSFINQLSGTTSNLFTAATNSNAGYRINDPIKITIIAISPGDPSSVTLGTYNVIVTAFPSTTSFSFVPVIPFTSSGGATTIAVFATAVSANQTNSLVPTIITNIYRLNESIPNVNSDRIVFLGSRMFHAPLPAGNVFEELCAPIWPGGTAPTGPNSLSNRPHALISFRFNLDQETWLIIADQQQMYKYRPATAITAAEFVPLGNAPPTKPATASAGGAGNLNSSGGTGYDWRYTYLDGKALTESNPSPINQSSGNVTEHPTAETNAGFTGVTTTGGTGAANASASGPTSVVTRCTWISFTVPGGTITALTLNVTISAIGSANSQNNTQSNCSCSVQYSFDNGVTFTNMFSQSAFSNSGIPGSFNTPTQTFSATIPSSASPANVQVQAVCSAGASGFPGLTATSNVTMTLSNIGLVCAFVSAVNALSLTNQSANVCVAPSPLLWQTLINLYRRGGSLTDNWRLVGQFPVSGLVQGSCGAGTLLINDNVSDTTLSTAAILQLDNDQPITSVQAVNQPLNFIWGPFGIDARVLGVGDPARPESVYFCKPGNADAWPPQNFVEVSNPGEAMIAGCVFNTRTFAFSREAIYELIENIGNGATFTPFRTPSAHGLYTSWGLALGPAVFFISKDGIYETVGGQEQSIVEMDIKPIFPTYDTPGQTIEGYEAVDYSMPDEMRLRYHNDEIYFIYQGLDTGELQMLIYDLLKKRWRPAEYSSTISELYSEPATTSSLLLGTAAGTVYQAGGSTDPTEPDLIQGVNIVTVSVATTIPTGTYQARVSRLTSVGEVALSYDFGGLVLNAGIGLSVSIPRGFPGTVAWRVYFGLSNTGGENQYIQFSEPAVAAAGRVVQITAPGVAGTIPTINADSNIHVDVRTGAHDQGVPLNQKQYGNVIVDLDPGGATLAQPVTITPLINGESVTEAAVTVTGTGRQQVPIDLTDYFAFNTEYEITWIRTALINPVLFQYDTLHFLEPAQLNHWQTQPTSFEFPGFVHIRDAYICIRTNTADVVMTVTIDNGLGTVTTQTYQIPNTNGLRLKPYIQFAPNKGLLYTFSIDSVTGQFRVYQPDLELRVKPWLGLLGYSTQRVIGGEAQ